MSEVNRISASLRDTVLEINFQFYKLLKSKIKVSYIFVEGRDVLSNLDNQWLSNRYPGIISMK